MTKGPTPETQGKYLTDINGIHKYARILIRRRDIPLYQQQQESELPMAAEEQAKYNKL